MSEPVVTNAANQKQIKRASVRESIKRKEEREDMLKLLGMPEGRRVFWRLLSFCNIYGSSYSDNPGFMAFREGQRNVGNKILADIMSVAPEAYITMMKENKES